jgi:hypothetical protein
LDILAASREKLLAELHKERASLTFFCGCGVPHRIKDCHALEKMAYTSPHGCMGGDYWSFSELNVICPLTDKKNRFLFDYTKVDWSLRDHFNHSAQAQFFRMYQKLFKSSKPDYDKDKREWWNNYYVDENHEVFGIDTKNGPKYY